MFNNKFHENIDNIIDLQIRYIDTSIICMLDKFCRKIYTGTDAIIFHIFNYSCIIYVLD